MKATLIKEPSGYFVKLKSGIYPIHPKYDEMQLVQIFNLPICDINDIEIDCEIVLINKMGREIDRMDMSGNHSECYNTAILLGESLCRFPNYNTDNVITQDINNIKLAFIDILDRYNKFQMIPKSFEKICLEDVYHINIDEIRKSANNLKI
jgi:hypothetical protein